MKKLIDPPKISNNKRMNEPATDMQLLWLKKNKLYKEGKKYSKRQCSKILSNQPANSKQILRLKEYGYDVSKGVTVGQWMATVNHDESFRNSLIHERNVIFPKRVELPTWYNEDTIPK